MAEMSNEDFVSNLRQSDSVWSWRTLFLRAAQNVVPELGRYLRQYGLPAEGADRRKIIREWQKRFHLNEDWVEHSAWTTLSMWDRDANLRKDLIWFAAPPSLNLAEIDIPIFKYSIERPFYDPLGFTSFKRSVHGALEEQLNAFGASHGGVDRDSRQLPRDLIKACECLALRVCKQLRPEEIRKRPGYAGDWTSLWKAMQKVAKQIDLELPRRGRPRAKSTD